MKNNNKGVTLVALTVTIIVLAILVGISLNVVVGDNGIIARAKKVSEDADMEIAREKLSLELANLAGDKTSDKNYDEYEYIDNRLISKGMTVFEDYVIVDNWMFEIDRTEPKIKNDMGQGTINPNIVINAQKSISSDAGNATIIANVIYNKGKIKTISIGGEEQTITENGGGRFESRKKVISNGTYSIMAIDDKGNRQFANIVIEELTADLEIYSLADLEQLRNDLKAGKTYEGKTVKVMANIDLGLSSTDSWEPLEGFKGTFYGNNFEINNLYINDTEGKGNQGFFGTVDEKAKINEVIIASGEIKSNGDNVGAIAGKSNGNIDGCENRIDVIGNNSVGGICGICEGGQVNDCFVNGKNVKATGSNIGGIIGGLTNKGKSKNNRKFC